MSAIEKVTRCFDPSVAERTDHIDDRKTRSVGPFAMHVDFNVAGRRDMA